MPSGNRRARSCLNFSTPLLSTTLSTALCAAPPRRPRRSGPIPAARALCLAALACLAAAPGGADPHWPIIEAYAADAAAGESPDIAAAVAAARAIVAEPDRPKAAAAAMFLMDAEGSATEADDALLGAAALAGIVGSDWSAVRAYLRERRILQARVEDIRASDAPRGERDARIAALARPAPQRAVAAALASLDAGDAARAGEAVRFLLWEHSLRSAHHILPEALRRYAQRFPGDAELPVLLWRAYAPPAGRSAPAAGLLEQFAQQDAAAPAVRATARYLLAGRVAEDAGRAADAQQRRRLHARSLRLAQGLSAGVEEREYAGPLLIGADPSPRIATFAQAEAELLYAIRHTVAGGTPPATQGRRLDGTAQALSAFAGKVVLVDFWATWCPPCVAALPKLRDLVARHSGSDFALLSISVDDSVDEVADFQYDQPMPWPNWHAGLDSDLLEAWRVRDFPTYLLLDRSGAIIARTNVFGDELLAALDQALAAAEG